MTTVWQISQMERTLADGGVVVWRAHWRATATDGDFSATNYGTAGFTPDPSAQTTWPYDDITEEVALDWCFADGVDKDATETSLQANIDGQINPVTASGVPW
jgi:hypothetical protein